MRRQVLVVDDEMHIRVGVGDLLRAEGLDVTTASSGYECIEKLAQGFRGLILLDIMMPDMDGWDTIRRMQAEGMVEGNLTVMLTALDAPGPQMEGLQELVTDYVVKPFDPQALIDLVHSYLALLP